MSFKNRIQLLIATTALLTFNPAYAGNEGVSFYYGASLGALMVDENTGYPGFDPAGTGGIFAGIEEDGWALEYLGFQSTESGTDLSYVDYKVTGSITSLGYRTIENNGTYYKLAYGKADTDVDLIVSGATATGNMEGKVYILGWGMRMRSGDRVELDYSYYDPDKPDNASVDFVSKAHMVSLRYMFGGSPAPRR